MEKKSQQPRVFNLDKAIDNKSYSTWNGKNWILIISFIFLSLNSSCVKKSEPVRLLFVGDILLSRNVKEEYNSRKINPWEKLETLFHSADLVIGNLEGAVGSLDEQINPLAQSPVFAIDSSDIVLLEKAGFKAVTIENNHSLDLGLKGKNRTNSILNKNNIKSISLKNSPYFFNIKGHTISIIALNLVINRDSSKYEVPSIELNQKLNLARALSNIVVVSVHWGSELLEWPNNEQRSAAKWLISKGADVILGHHPHVVQRPELIDGKPVYFSLGNHLFDQKYLSTKVGMIAELELKNGKLYCKGITTQTQKHSFYPEIQSFPESFFEPIEFSKQSLKIKNLKIIPENIDLVNKILLKAYDNDRLLWKSHPMSLVALQKIQIDENEDHLFSLESYYSSLDEEINTRPYVYAIDKKGITAKWRGSALAWPILDAQISRYNDQILCALHRGDAFIMLRKSITEQKVAAYKWNGFGFNLINDSTICKQCELVFD